MAFLNLFPEKRLARLKKLFPFVSMPEVEAASVAFDFLSKRYFGLGFITSFVPGTYAYQARKNLSEKVEVASQDLLNEEDVPVLESLPVKPPILPHFTTRDILM